MRYGIDVSENNGVVDWQAVKDAGYDFAIVRCSYGKTGRDDKFLENVNGAHAVGLQVGAYHYGYGLTPYDATIEASNCKEAISESGVLLELPVFYDMEDADGYKARHSFDFSRDNVTEICHTFLGYMYPLDCGVYASEAWLNDCIDWRSLGCAVWNAAWKNGYNPTADDDGTDGIKGFMWQYTSRADIGGKEFDADVIYD
jgi:GH25 family lysozyme M1 (1,4-beta-N-acetylmuramidase)